MNTDAGGFLSFGATWAELNVRLPGGTYQYEQTMYVESGGMVRMGKSLQSGKGWGTMPGISLPGNIFLYLTKVLPFFPMVKK